MVVVLAGEGHPHETSKLGGSVVAPVSHACGIGPPLVAGELVPLCFSRGAITGFLDHSKSSRI